jgi:hypothetical protein
MILLVYALVLHIYACDEVKNTCDIICKTDGDELGIIYNNYCYCSNKRDMSKFVLKLPKIRGFVDKSMHREEQ